MRKTVAEAPQEGGSTGVSAEAPTTEAYPTYMPMEGLPTSAEEAAPQESGSTEVSAEAPATEADPAYPSYMPMAGLLPPKRVLHVLCDESRAAGKHVLAKGESFPSGDYSAGGVELIYEAVDDSGAACVYPFAPWKPVRGSGSNDWPSGSQFIWRSAVPGHRVTFRTNDAWAKLHFRAGEANGKRYHVEVQDIELDFPKANQSMGAFHIEAFPYAKSGGLITAVVRRSRLTGGKNALFIPTGSTMLYVENSEIGRNVGTNVDQEHSIYINAALVSHFKDSLVFGQYAIGDAGGHILKDKSSVRIYENLTLDNGGGIGDPTNRPLGDWTSFGWTWTENLSLVRRKSNAKTRQAMVDMRRGRYQNSRMSVPWMNAKDWKMPTVAGDCSGDVANDVYLHVFKNTVATSEVTEPFTFRMNGQVDTWFNGIHETASYDDIMANPGRDRAMLLSFNTDTPSAKVTGDGYAYNKPTYATYHCENPTGLASSVSALVNDKNAFIKHALTLIDAANGNAIPLPWK